ncbi:putative Eyes absent family, EYA domain superfamily [Helianthus debilis subsp. tardiflorus]
MQGLRSLYGENMIKSWDNLYEVTDDFTDKWLSSARTCVEQCAGGNNDPGAENINVIVTSGSLIPSLVKCLLFRLDDLISYDNG